MYTISKAPSKLVVGKTRRGISQNFDKYDAVRELTRKNSNGDTSEISLPKPVFQTSRKTLSYLKTQQQHRQEMPEVFSPQHEELIKYMNESWKMVVAENPYDEHADSDSTSNSSLSSSTSSTLSSNSIYYVDPPSPVLNDFQAFDLESWWGRRLFNNITKSL